MKLKKKVLFLKKERMLIMKFIIFIKIICLKYVANNWSSKKNCKLKILPIKFIKRYLGYKIILIMCFTIKKILNS